MTPTQRRVGPIECRHSPTHTPPQTSDVVSGCLANLIRDSDIVSSEGEACPL